MYMRLVFFGVVDIVILGLWFGPILVGGVDLVLVGLLLLVYCYAD